MKIPKIRKNYKHYNETQNYILGGTYYEEVLEKGRDY